MLQSSRPGPPVLHEASREDGRRPQVLVPEASQAPQNVETRPHSLVPPLPSVVSLGRGTTMGVGWSHVPAGCGENPRVTPGTVALARARVTAAGHWPGPTGQGRAPKSHVPGGRFPWNLSPRATEAPTRVRGHTSGGAGLRPPQPGTPRGTRAPGPWAAPSFAQSASHRGRPSGSESPRYRVITIPGEPG